VSAPRPGLAARMLERVRFRLHGRRRLSFTREGRLIVVLSIGVVVFLMVSVVPGIKDMIAKFK
jgi:hypothetical protein